MYPNNDKICCTMGLDAFIDFMLSFFPLKQMERIRNAVSTHTADPQIDLDNIQDAFRELLPWLGAKYQYYRLLVPSVIAIMDERQMDGLCCMFTTAYQELQHQVSTHEFYKEGYVPNGSVKGGKDYYRDIGKPILSAILSKGNVRLSDVVMPSGLNYSHDELNRVLGDVVIMIQNSMQMTMDRDIYEGNMCFMALARALSVELNCHHAFYHLMGIFQRYNRRNSDLWRKRPSGTRGVPCCLQGVSSMQQSYGSIDILQYTSALFVSNRQDFKLVMV